MISQDAGSGFRRTAKLVGALFLAGMIVGIAGHNIIQSIMDAPQYLSTVSTNSLIVALGAMLMLLTSVGDAAHGILMIPVLKQHSERIAVGYSGFRLIDAAFPAVQVLYGTPGPQRFLYRDVCRIGVVVSAGCVWVTIPTKMMFRTECPIHGTIFAKSSSSDTLATRVA
jgi:hypothetical protein